MTSASVHRAVIAAGRRHSVGVRRDGTVIATGPAGSPECAVGQWRGVVAVAAGSVHAARNTGRSHTVALHADGTATATGWNDDGQCDVDEWTGVASIATGWRRTLATLTDGTVVAAGRPHGGACHWASTPVDESGPRATTRAASARCRPGETSWPWPRGPNTVSACAPTGPSCPPALTLTASARPGSGSSDPTAGAATVGRSRRHHFASSGALNRARRRRLARETAVQSPIGRDRGNPDRCQVVG